MSEPLNDFLEAVEACIQATGTSDELLGNRVRELWTEMQYRERQITEFVKKHGDARERFDVNGKRVKITIPLGG